MDHERFNELLDAKLERRGDEAIDDRFRFTASEGALEMYRSSDVPRPVAGGSVTEVQWTADLTRCTALSAFEVAGLLHRIVH